ncbi:MAG: hypothetical protein JW838_04625 [Spirochaetes bacterium]|nr:hypothetical protein [Spirochaetota bacterium]
MNPGKNFAVLPVVFVAMALSLRVAGEAPDEKARVLLDRSFYIALRRTPRIMRNSFLEKRLNALVVARGMVSATGENKLFDKRYRIILTDPEAESLGMRIVYHIYADRLDSIEMLSEHRLYEFSGRLVAYTPLSTKRESYILDVILEKGAVVIE